MRHEFDGIDFTDEALLDRLAVLTAPDAYVTEGGVNVMSDEDDRVTGYDIIVEAAVHLFRRADGRFDVSTPLARVGGDLSEIARRAGARMDTLDGLTSMPVGKDDLDLGQVVRRWRHTRGVTVCLLVNADDRTVALLVEP